MTLCEPDEKIRVPEAWQTFEVQGEGVVVGVIDTGIDPNHPDLVGKIRPQNGWFDAVNGQPTPYDDEGHGTYVAGTIAGGNASGTHIGVAPKATLIVAKALDASGFGTFEWLTASMQWMMDPDGDPNTDDGADVVNNSWGTLGSTSPTMIPEWRDILNAWIAARIFPAFGIGNEGPNPRTTGSPGDYPMAFGVGATDVNDQIADFSSRGPVFWTGIGDIVKPDVSAPGVGVMSSVPGGSYERWDGTSMACPHVAGTVALMLSLAIKNRRINEIDVDFLKQALEETAVDLGPPGKDNDYGSGRIDAYEALRKIPPPPVVGFPSFAGSTFEASIPEVTVGETINFTLRVVNSGNASAFSVVATVPNIPNLLSSVTPQDGGTFDPVNRRVVWSLSELKAGQSAILRFSADASAEGVVGLVAQISAPNAQTFVSNPVSIRIVSPSDPFEPNNILSAAAELAGIETLTDRAYLVEGDEDWFKVRVDAGKVIWIEVRAWQVGSLLDAKLSVTDESGQTLSQGQVLFAAQDYIGYDPVAVVKGNGSYIYIKVSVDDDASPARKRGSYFLRLKEIATSLSLQNIAVDSLTGEKALRAGEVGIVLGTLRNEGSILPFQVQSGLRMVQPSRSRIFTPPSPRPTEPVTEPGMADWLVFIVDPDETSLSEVQRLPAPILNLGRIWAQEREGVLFFRLEFVGRALTNLTDADLTVELDTNNDEFSDARVVVSALERALYIVQERRSLAFINISERLLEFGVRVVDLNNSTQIKVRAQLKDKVTGTVDNAPDFGWALLTRDDPNTEQDDGFAFGFAPAAGTISPNSYLTVWLVADARTARIGDYSVTALIPSSASILPTDWSKDLPVRVEAGQPVRLTLELSGEGLVNGEVPATTEQVTATATLSDAALNPVKGATLRFTVSPTSIGNIDGSAFREVVTDENGQANVVIRLTGQTGVLDIDAEVLGTGLAASRTLMVRPGAPVAIDLITTPSADEQGFIRVPVGGKILLKATLKDIKGNLIFPVEFQFGIIPVEGTPQVKTVVDGSVEDEDETVNGSVQLTLDVGTKTGEMVLSVSTPNAPQIPPKSVTISVQPGLPTQLAFVDPQQENELNSSIAAPLVKLEGDTLSIRVRLMDAYGNPVFGQTVNLSIQHGLSVKTLSSQTDKNGEAVFNVTLEVGNLRLWLLAAGLRLPKNWQQAYRITVLPKLDNVSHERVRGLSIPFLPPSTSGQVLSLAELLGVEPQVLERRIVRYNPVRREFEFVDPNAPLTEIGTGFFVKPRQTVNIRPRSGKFPDTDTIEIALQPGWNLIGFPIVVEFTWRLTNFQVRVGTITRPLSQATDAIAPFLWRWDAVKGSYQFVYDPTLAQGDFEKTVKPWEAYFAYAYQPCTLVVPVPIGARKREAPNRGSDLQLFSLQISRKSGVSTLVLGLSKNGQVSELPLPPNPSSPTRVALLNENSESLGVSIKPVRPKVSWIVVLTGGEEDEEVTIGAGNLAPLGRNWSLTLFDPALNMTCSLRTGVYRLRLAAGEGRQLQIIAEQSLERPLQVQNLRVTPLRGRGLTVEFSLTGSAETEVTVQTLTGRTIRVLDKSFKHAGTHRLIWDSSVDASLRVPNGIYLVRVVARDEKGRVAQSVVSTKLR